MMKLHVQHNGSSVDLVPTPRAPRERVGSGDETTKAQSCPSSPDLIFRARPAALSNKQRRTGWEHGNNTRLVEVGLMQALIRCFRGIQSTMLSEKFHSNNVSAQISGDTIKISLIHTQD